MELNQPKLNNIIDNENKNDFKYNNIEEFYNNVFKIIIKQINEIEKKFIDYIQTAGIKAIIENNILNNFNNISKQYHRVINNQNSIINGLKKQIESLRENVLIYLYRIKI